jgi:hypothetical protein
MAAVTTFHKRLCENCHSGLDPESNYVFLARKQMLNQAPLPDGQVQHDKSLILTQPLNPGVNDN